MTAHHSRTPQNLRRRKRKHRHSRRAKKTRCNSVLRQRPRQTRPNRPRTTGNRYPKTSRHPYQRPRLHQNRHSTKQNPDIINVHQRKLTVGETRKRLKTLAETKTAKQMKNQIIFLQPSQNPNSQTAIHSTLALSPSFPEAIVSATETEHSRQAKDTQQPKQPLQTPTKQLPRKRHQHLRL